MKKSNIVAASAVVAAALGAAGVFGWGMGVATHEASAGTTSPASVARAATILPTHLYLTIVTPAMTGSQVGPAVLPSQATVPAFSDVTVTIVNFDDATPLTGSYQRYAASTGSIKGTILSQPIEKTNPNAVGKSQAQTYTSLDPNLVSHTFTIPSLNLNVPILAASRTTFTFHTGGAGTFEWHCQDPCGTGPSGWSGAMSTLGYMGGLLTVA